VEVMTRSGARTNWFGGDGRLDSLWRRVDRRLALRCRTDPSRRQASLEVRGQIDDGCALAFARLLEELVDSGITTVRLDAAGLDYLDVGGARVFASTACDLEAKGGRLRVQHAKEAVERVLSMSGLGRLLISPT